MGPAAVDQTYYQGRHCGENWGEERKPIFIQQGENRCSSPRLFNNATPLPSITAIASPSCPGSFDISSLPTYVNTQQIDAQVLAALQAEAENVTKGMAAAAKESPRKDLFDMSKCGLRLRTGGPPGE